jgi:hypothetical protein
LDFFQIDKGFGNEDAMFDQSQKRRTTGDSFGIVIVGDETASFFESGWFY